VKAKRYYQRESISWEWVSLPILLLASLTPAVPSAASGATIYPEVIEGDLCAGGQILVGIFVENNTTGSIEVFNFTVCWDPVLTYLGVSPGDFGPIPPASPSGNCLREFLGTDPTPSMWNGCLFKILFEAPPTETGPVELVQSISDYFIPMFFAQGSIPIPHDFDASRDNGWCGPTPTVTETPTVTPTRPTPTPLIAAVYSELVSGDTCYPNTVVVSLNLEANEVGPLGDLALEIEWNPSLSFVNVSICDYAWEDGSMRVEGNTASLQLYNSLYTMFRNGCVIELILSSPGFEPGPVDLIYSITDAATPEFDTTAGEWIPHRFDLRRDDAWCGEPWTPTVTGTPTVTPTPTPRIPDWNHDGRVDGEDLAILIRGYHTLGGGQACDLTGDGDADEEELFIFTTWWGRAR